MKPYPNYGQYILIDYFKAFMHGFPYPWADKKYWDVDKKSLPFDFLRAFMDEYSQLRTNMFGVFYLVLDGSMSGWRLKTSKTGGLPQTCSEMQ